MKTLLLTGTIGLLLATSAGANSWNQALERLAGQAQIHAETRDYHGVRLVVDHWRNQGQRLRQYRNGVLASEAILRWRTTPTSGHSNFLEGMWYRESDVPNPGNCWHRSSIGIPWIPDFAPVARLADDDELGRQIRPQAQLLYRHRTRRGTELLVRRRLIDGPIRALLILRNDLPRQILVGPREQRTSTTLSYQAQGSIGIPTNVCDY